MSSLKNNIVLNFINTLSGIIIPVITFPYAARVLNPECIGAVNFLNSVVNYIVLLTSLGLPMYAVRKVAKCRNDVALRNKTTVEITALAALLCLVGMVLVVVLSCMVERIHSHLLLFYILSLSIPFSALGVNWFYQAVEDFKFITIRALVFRFLTTVMLFVFVHSPKDLLMYGVVIVATTVGNNFINFVHLRKYISCSQIRWRELQIFRHLTPALHIFVLNLIVGIYYNLNTVMLGFMQDDKAVGLYSAGNKLSYMILTLVTSLGVVMVPRCSNLIENGDRKTFSEISSKAYRLVIALSLPLVVGIILLSHPVLLVFAGTQYVDAVSVIHWTAPIILFIGLTNVIGIQILYPQNKENIVMVSAIGAAVSNVLLNLLLIPVLSYTGAAIATFAAELTALIMEICVGRRYIPFRLFQRSIGHYLFAVMLMALAVWGVYCIELNVYVRFVLCIITGMLVYGGTLAILRDELFYEMSRYAFNLISRK